MNWSTIRCATTLHKICYADGCLLFSSKITKNVLQKDLSPTNINQEERISLVFCRSNILFSMPFEITEEGRVLPP